MFNHSALCRSIEYDYINSLTWAILKKTQLLNGCETFAFKYINESVISGRVFLSYNGPAGESVSH